MTTKTDALIDGLTHFVSAGPHRGVLLEASKSAPVLDCGNARDRVGRWRRPGQAFKAQVPRFVPASYRAFLEKYGSLTWLAPEHDAPEGWFSLHNQAAKTLIELPEGNRCIDVFDPVPDEAEQARLGLRHLWVFHDGYSQSFAFDERVLERGEPVVLTFKDEDLMTPLEERLERLERHGTFVDWLAARIGRFTRALANRQPPTRAGSLVPVPVALPTDRAEPDEVHDLLQVGVAHLEAQRFDAALANAQHVLALAPRFLYGYSQAIDALAGMVPCRFEEQWRLAWMLLGLCREDDTTLHEDYVKLYRQKSATVLAELALVAPSLVTRAQAHALIDEALSIHVDNDANALTGHWDSRATQVKLGATPLDSRS